MLPEIIRDDGREGLRRFMRDFQNLNTQEPPPASSIVSGIQTLPGLVGFWPGAVDRGTPVLLDVSGNGLHLTPSNATVGYDGAAPCTIFPAGSDARFSVADNAKLDILGTDTIINSDYRGLTMMLWAYFDNPANGSVQMLMGKWNETGNQRSYQIVVPTSGAFLTFYISSNGSTASSLSTPSSSLATGWQFIAARFRPSTELAVWINTAKHTNTTSIVASIFNSTALFYLGGKNVGVTGSLYGKISFPVLCAAALSDDHINDVYSATLPLFS